MPTWVVLLINGVLLVYCVVMLIIGHIKKKKRIAQSMKDLKEEFEYDQRETHKEVE